MTRTLCLVLVALLGLEAAPAQTTAATVDLVPREGIGGKTVLLRDDRRSLAFFPRLFDYALDLGVELERPAQFGMAVGVARDGELVTAVPSDDLVVRRSGAVQVYDEESERHRARVREPFDAFDDPLVGIAEKLEEFEDPIFGFDDPLVGIWGDGDTYYEEPLFGFETPVEALKHVWEGARERVEAEYALVVIAYTLRETRWGVRGSAVVAPFTLEDRGARGAGARAAGWAASVEASGDGGLDVSPNPFAGAASVAFETAEAGPVRVALLDVLGREVAVAADGERPAGAHRVGLEARGLPAGTYLVRVEAGRSVRAAPVTVAR